MIDSELKDLLRSSAADYGQMIASPIGEKRNDIETRLVGSIVCARSNANQLLARLAPLSASDFRGPSLMQLVEALVSVVAAGGDIADPNCVTVGLIGRGHKGVFGAFASCMNSVVSGCNFDHYRRCMINLVAEEHEQAMKAKAAKNMAAGMDDAENIARDLNAGLKAIRDKYLPEEAERSAGIESCNRIEQILQTTEAPRGAIKTGIASIDRMVYRLMPGESIVLAARPSVGKTGLALQIALNQASMGRRVCVFSLEMGSDQLANRILANLTGHDTRKLMRCPEELTDEERQMFSAHIPLLRETMAKIDICDEPSVTLETIRQHSRRSVGRGACLLVFDYLQLFQDVKSAGDNRNLEVAAVSRAWKLLCKELQVPGLILSQLNRESEKLGKAGREPKLSDLRDSGAIEQDADIVWLLDDPDSRKRDASKRAGDRDISVIQAKGRDVGVGFAKLRFWVQRQMFAEVEYQQAQRSPEPEPDSEPVQERWWQQ